MKKSIILAVLLTVISATVFASTGTTALSTTSKFQVVENTDSRYDLYYVSETLDDVVIRILNEDGKLINTDKLTDIKAFKRTYNLKGLPAGNYEIEVKNGEGKATQSVFHNPMKSTNLHTIVGQLPSLNKFRVFVGSNDQNKKVVIKIVDDRSNVLVVESINNAQNGFSKVFDLSKVKANYVTFKVTNGTENTTYTRDLK